MRNDLTSQSFSIIKPDLLITHQTIQFLSLLLIEHYFTDAPIKITDFSNGNSKPLYCCGSTSSTHLF